MSGRKPKRRDGEVNHAGPSDHGELLRGGDCHRPEVVAGRALHRTSGRETAVSRPSCQASMPSGNQ